MKEELAKKLLALTMNWEESAVSKERPDLEALCMVKYDEYQQFSPGMRFIESLARWVEQFADQEERYEAYNFVRNRLVFISNAEMKHLVSITFRDFIRPLLFKQVAENTSLHPHHVRRIFKSNDYSVLLRRSLFLGLSDGAHTDIFRRVNSNSISNEQVVPVYQIADERADNLLVKLDHDVKILNSTLLEKQYFCNLFLLDDFTASGLSYFRKESGEYHGKIYKVLEAVINEENPMSKLFNKNNYSIFLILYVATDRALQRIKECIDNWKEDNESLIDIKTIVIQELPSRINVDEKKDSHFFHLLQKYFDSGILTVHYRKGKHERPYLGFNECALPIVLSHNCPNNTVPLIWFNGEEKDRLYHGLFPRISRHREEWF